MRNSPFTAFIKVFLLLSVLKQLYINYLSTLGNRNTLINAVNGLFLILISNNLLNILNPNKERERERIQIIKQITLN